MNFKIAETREEKKQVIMYYDNIRKEMAKFRDEIDSIAENKYHAAVMERIKINKELDDSKEEIVNVSPPQQHEIVSNPPSPTNVSDDSQEFGYLEYMKSKIKRAYWGCGF